MVSSQELAAFRVELKLDDLREKVAQLVEDIWVPAHCCRTESINTHKKLLRVLKGNRIRTRRKGQRLYVHGLEWLYSIADAAKNHSFAAVDKYVADTEKAKARARKKKKANDHSTAR